MVPFIADMPAAFAEADLVVCRSGAGAVSELAAAGKPPFWSPFPFAADDHQTRNAEAMERAGAARLVPDAEMNGEKLFGRGGGAGGAIRAALERMGEAARRFAQARGRRGGRRRFWRRWRVADQACRFPLTVAAVSRNNTIRKCFLVRNTCISRGSAGSA